MAASENRNRRATVTRTLENDGIDKAATEITLPFAKKIQDRRSDKAQILLTVSLDLFEKSHFSNVTTKEIAAIAGFNSALLYYYFESKENLFRSVVEMAVQCVLEQFEILQATAETPRDVITGWLETHIRQFDIIRKFVKISIDYASSGARSDEIDAAIARFYDSERSVLTSTIRAGIASGMFNDVDADQVATFISTNLDGVMVRSITFKELDFRQEIRNLNDFMMSHLGCRG